jgi:hypothetical protein
MRLPAWVCLCCIIAASASYSSGQVLDKQRILESETFWDNRDWEWYLRMIPFFECPDRDIQTTYYYRWELLTKHLTYGSPRYGYTFTEFIDRPFWSGAYGSISCPAGHQLYEARWLRESQFVEDFGRYWFTVPGAEPRRYSTWLADAIWAAHLVHPNEKHLGHLLPQLIENYSAWEKSHFDADVGLFWQTGHDDGMEININSRQTTDRVRGAPGYRPTLNSYLIADAQAIAAMARHLGDTTTAPIYERKASQLKSRLQELLWDRKREFFFHMARRDETLDGFTVKARTLTYQTGRFAGNPHGREEIGFVPWQFRIPDARYLPAWKYLMDPNYFYAPFGPTTVERHDPLFEISKRCCVWSGNSWPYATTQTLKAMANVLQFEQQSFVSKRDYIRLLHNYSVTHRKNGQPYIAEACHPDTGSWEGHDSYNHSEHYFHSGYIDLVITGIVGIVTTTDHVIEVRPLIPEDWGYCCLDGVRYKGHDICIVWDRDGKRYGRGSGLSILVDGQIAAKRMDLGWLKASLPEATQQVAGRRLVNFAVNNDGTYYPRLWASVSGPASFAFKLNDGNYWYHQHPPNRWTSEGSENKEDWVAIDFGRLRTIHEIVLKYLDDGQKILPPIVERIEIDGGKGWQVLSKFHRSPERPVGRRANRIEAEVTARKVRIWFQHADMARTGLTEIEMWGPPTEEIGPAMHPMRNIAPMAKIRASHTFQGDRVEDVNDGRIFFSPHPRNRWTCFGTPHPEDVLTLEWDQPKKIAKVELAIFDDGGGVRSPDKVEIEYWNGKEWAKVPNRKSWPDEPIGGQINTVIFDPIETKELRIRFVHRKHSSSGITELLVFPENDGE